MAFQENGTDFSCKTWDSSEVLIQNGIVEYLQAPRVLGRRERYRPEVRGRRLLCAGLAANTMKCMTDICGVNSGGTLTNKDRE